MSFFFQSSSTSSTPSHFQRRKSHHLTESMASSSSLNIRTPEEAGMSFHCPSNPRPRNHNPKKKNRKKNKKKRPPERHLTQSTSPLPPYANLYLSIVARIAYLSSDVVVSVQPSQAVDSEFSSHLHRYADRKDSSIVASSGVPEVQCPQLTLQLTSKLTITSRSKPSDTMPIPSSPFSPQSDLESLFPSPRAPPSSFPPYHNYTDSHTSQ